MRWMSAGSPESAAHRNGPGAAAEERPDVGGDEAREVEGMLEAGIARLGAQVVAVVEDVAAGVLQVEHRLHVPDGRLARPAHVLVGVRVAQRERVGELDARRHVAVQHVVRRGLVGHEVEVRRRGGRSRRTRRRRFRGSRPTRPARRRRGAAPGRARRRGRPRPRRGSASRGGARSGAGRPRRSGWRRPAERRGQRLRAAHPAEPGREDGAARPGRASPSGSRRPPRTSGRCPGGSPGCRCRSTTPPSSARTS